MPLTFNLGQIKPSKPVTLKSNLNLGYSFTPGTTYPVRDITCRPGGVDFALKTGEKLVYFRDVDFWNKGIEFVKE